MPITGLHDNADNDQHQEDHPIVSRGWDAKARHDEVCPQQHGQYDDRPIEQGGHQDQPDNAADNVDHPIPGSDGYTQRNCQRSR